MPAEKNPADLWIYKREPAGMGEWCYRIYRNGVYMFHVDDVAFAIAIVNALDRDEKKTGIEPIPVPCCFGKYPICPCDDECKVSLLCEKAASFIPKTSGDVQ